jgi:hypothetical protein
MVEKKFPFLYNAEIFSLYPCDYYFNNRINSIKIKLIVIALIGKDRIYCI